MRGTRARSRSSASSSSSSSGCSTCLRCILKLLNFLLAFVGFAIFLYSLWVIYKLPSLDLSSSSIQQEQEGDGRTLLLPHSTLILPSAWFVYFLLGLGAVICLITLFGHIGAETANGCCLSCYIFFVVLLILLQGAFVADIFLNENWQESIPADSTGLFDYIKSFVEENLDICKWVGLAVVIVEGLSVLVALCVRATTSSSRSSSYDSDDEYIVPRSRIRQPLLINQQGAEVAMPNTGITVEGWPNRPDAWSSKMRDKYGLAAGKQVP